MRIAFCLPALALVAHSFVAPAFATIRPAFDAGYHCRGFARPGGTALRFELSIKGFDGLRYQERRLEQVRTEGKLLPDVDLSSAPESCPDGKPARDWLFNGRFFYLTLRCGEWEAQGTCERVENEPAGRPPLPPLRH